MYKIIIGLLVCFSTLLNAQVYNGPTNLSLKFLDDVEFNGPAKLHMVKAKSLVAKGPLEFTKLDVQGSATVYGPFKGTNGKFGQLTVTGPFEGDHIKSGSLTINGPVHATYVDIDGPTTITGPVTVQNGKFKSLSVKGDVITLEEVTADTITIPAENGPQKLVLKGNTVINGDIVFESGSGILEKQGPDVQIKGSVKGVH